MKFTREQILEMIQERIEGLEANKRHHCLFRETGEQDRLEQRILELESFRLDLLLMEELE